VSLPGSQRERDGSEAEERFMENRNSVPLDAARSRLAWVWFIGTAFVLVLVIIQSLMNRYGSRTQEAWEWLLPTIMPTLGMILSGLICTALDPLSSEVFVRRSFVRVALWLSGFYQALILLTILSQPFTDLDPIDLMHRSNLWLGPIQGLVGAAIGVLFVSKQKGPAGKDAEPAQAPAHGAD
jgi:uncharacterized integral membrane protein